MPDIKVRHLVMKTGADGPRFYWQPSAELRADGWRNRALRTPEGALVRDRMAAAAMAEDLNAEVDAWRRGEMPPNAPAPMKAREEQAKPGTVKALIDDYQASRFWTDRQPATRRQYQWCLDLIQEWAGTEPVRAITPPAIQAFYESQLTRVEGAGRKKRTIRTPAKAAAVYRVLRLLLQAGERLGYLRPQTNPALRAGITYKRARDPVLWTPDVLAHMVATADEMGWRSIGTAMMLNEWLGQRQGDLLRLPPWKAEGGALVFRQGKTDRLVALPLHLVPHLVARLQAEEARPGRVVSLKDAAVRLLLNDSTGQQWSAHTFRHLFAEIRDKASEAMPECRRLLFMELRHTAVTRLHEAGVDELGIGGVTGHSASTVKQMLDDHYLVRTEKAAEGAFRKRLAAEENEAATGL